MSRTKRKTHYAATRSLQEQIDREVFWAARVNWTKTVRKRKPKELYEAQKAAANQLHWFVSRYTYETVPYSYEEAVKKATFDYNRWLRDKYTETTQKTGFKKQAAKTVRIANKRYCNKVLRDDGWEDIIYPDQHLGDEFVWNWW